MFNNSLRAYKEGLSQIHKEIDAVITLINKGYWDCSGLWYELMYLLLEAEKPQQ